MSYILWPVGGIDRELCFRAHCGLSAMPRVGHLVLAAKSAFILLYVTGLYRCYQGILTFSRFLLTSSRHFYWLSSGLVGEGGMFAPKGKAGSVLLFHSTLVHGSAPNMSPFDRTIVYLSLCHVDNHIRRFKRPEYIAHRDFAPLVPLPDDCLLSESNDGHSLAANS